VVEPFASAAFLAWFLPDAEQIFARVQN
jgi:hypothetical protein